MKTFIVFSFLNFRSVKVNFKLWSCGFLQRMMHNDDCVAKLIQVNSPRLGRYRLRVCMSHLKTGHSPQLHQQPSYQGPIVHAGSAAALWGDWFWTVDSESNVFRFPLGSRLKNSVFNAVCAPNRVPQKTLALSRCEVFLDSPWLLCGLVFLLLVVGLSLGNRFHKISGVEAAAQGQQSRSSSQQHVEADNRPPFVCWDSVREGSAGVQRCSDMAPLGLREQQEEVSFMLFSRNINNSKDIIVTWAMAPAKKMVQSSIQLHPGVLRP